MLFILPFTSCAGFYWYAGTIEEINREFPNQEVINNIKNIEDIEAVKRLLISSYRSDQKEISKEVSVYYTFTKMLLSFAIFNAVFLFIFYRAITNKALTIRSSGTNNP